MPRSFSRRLALVVATVSFAIGIPLGVVIAAPSFNDVTTSNPFYNDIRAIAVAGVTSGCGGGNYCPKDYVTREQMAAFMNRLGALGEGKTPVVNADTLHGNDTFLLGRTGGFAYAWANLSTSDSYTPDSDYSFNSSGDAVHVTRSATGEYFVEFASLPLSHGVVQVTKYGDAPGECHVVGWGPTVGVHVKCYDPSGSPADSQFTITYMD